VSTETGQLQTPHYAATLCAPRAGVDCDRWWSRPSPLKEPRIDLRRRRLIRRPRDDVTREACQPQRRWSRA
jgi:hypothetical protein